MGRGIRTTDSIRLIPLTHIPLPTSSPRITAITRFCQTNPSFCGGRDGDAVLNEVIIVMFGQVRQSGPVKASQTNLGKGKYMPKILATKEHKERMDKSLCCFFVIFVIFCGQIVYGCGLPRCAFALMAAFRKWLDEEQPADPKIEVSVVENKVRKYCRKCQNGNAKYGTLPSPFPIALPSPSF
jgi:hypothetical protein